MQYFGVPRCPYCKKRVNIISSWSLKRQGEYLCPRCGGISNIYLSPLIYVAAVIALFVSGIIYFFHKFVLDDIELKTAVEVFIPFAAFFVVSLFMVYLKKPVIKTISREDLKKGRRGVKKTDVKRAPLGQEAFDFEESNNYDYTPVGPPVRLTPDENAFVSGDRPIEIAQPAFNIPVPKSGKTMVMPELEAAGVKREPEFPQIQTSGLTGTGSTSIPLSSPIPERRTAQRVQPPVSAPQKKKGESGDSFFDKYEDEDYINQRLEQLRKNREKG